MSLPKQGERGEKKIKLICGNVIAVIKEREKKFNYGNLIAEIKGEREKKKLNCGNLIAKIRGERKKS